MISTPSRHPVATSTRYFFSLALMLFAGTAGAVDWTPSALVKSRTTAPYVFAVVIDNPTTERVTDIEVVNPQNNTWIGLADAGGSSMGSRPVHTSGTTDTLRYSGKIKVGASAILNIQFTDIPVVSASTVYTFQVRYVPFKKDNMQTFDQIVTLAVSIDDVGGLSILSTATGQLLTWTNTSREDAVHDGVVVFRANAPTVPAMPVDGTDYSDDPSAFYFDDNGSTVESLDDPVVGTYNYRVCNHDANLIYSNCNTGFWNNAGWLDSVVAPADGWSHNLGGQMLLRPGVIPGGLVGVVNNVPNVNVLETSTGQKAFSALSLTALPSVGTPMVQLDNGRRILFAADQAGTITTEDVDSGETYWTAKTGEAFTAGVFGVIRKYTSTAFQTAYATDILLLGSTTGNLLAVDATSGVTIWTVSVGFPVRATVKYDYTKNWIYVPTDGGGIIAYDLAGSSDLGVPPALASSWVNPGGSYSLPCADGSKLICADRDGTVRIIDRSTGSIIASGASGFTSPSSIWAISNGVVVTNARNVTKLLISETSLIPSGNWTLGATVALSPVLAFQSINSIYVGASDGKLHKLSISGMAETAFVSVQTQSSGAFLGSPTYDVTNNFFLFGSSDGHLWAVKYF